MISYYHPTLPRKVHSILSLRLNLVSISVAVWSTFIKSPGGLKITNTQALMD